MFVSSYSTYIQADTSAKSSRQRIEKSNLSSKDFGEKLDFQEKTLPKLQHSPLGVDYLRDAKTQHNKLELEYQKRQLNENQEGITPKDTLKRFALQSSLSNAFHAYENANKRTSLHSNKATTLDQTPKISDYLPEEAKFQQELNMKKLMVNTYVANDRYYRVTA